MKKLVIVTGATSGIGLATVEVLESAGYQIVALGRNTKVLGHLTKRFGSQKVKPYAIDLTSAEEISSFFNSTDITWQNLYGLVNCAGISVGEDIFDLTLKDWQLDMSVNLQAPFLMMQGVMKKLVQFNQAGSIVNISSLAGIVGAKKPNYSASKSGLLGLTKSAALRGGQFGIRVNAIFPGAVKTPMTADWDDAKISVIAGATPLKRLAEASEISRAILWLLSEDSSFVTGAVLNVTGGQYAGQ